MGSITTKPAVGLDASSLCPLLLFCCCGGQDESCSQLRHKQASKLTLAPRCSVISCGRKEHIFGFSASMRMHPCKSFHRQQASIFHLITHSLIHSWPCGHTLIFLHVRPTTSFSIKIILLSLCSAQIDSGLGTFSVELKHITT